MLVGAAVVSIGAAMAMGLAYGGLRLLPFVVIGGLFVFGYNLELAGGVLHNDLGFAVTWGGFPVLVGAYAQHWTLPPAAWVAAVAAVAMSLGQRSLSTPVRALRRRVTLASVRITWRDGSQREYGRAELLAPAGAGAARVRLGGRRAGRGAGARPVSPLRPVPADPRLAGTPWSSARARPAASPRWCWPGPGPTSPWWTRRPSRATRPAAT